MIDLVRRRIRYEVTPEGLDAVEILARGSGDCTEYSILTVSLLRAAGIPAELREGMAIDGGEMVAGHLEAPVLDFISLLSMGKLKIVSVERAKK